MFSFLNFLKKIFNNHSPKALVQFYQHAGHVPALWVSLAINKKSIANSFLTKELDLLTGSDSFSLKMAETKEGIRQHLWRNQQSLCQSNAELMSPFLLEFNQLVDKLIETEILYFQSFLNQAGQEKILSPSEIAQEEKALEWIRVSFQVLGKAIIESLTNPDFLFQTLIFFGVNQKTATHEIRVITFNLDIKFELLDSGALRVRIYNDKGAESQGPKKAALEGDFNFRKREMLDELTRLVSLLSTGIKW